ncbi:acetolactate synthase large subunit [Methylophilus sp. QUAN]|uniref:acetolactate synthase large subunit n=1 Tax=Methylophilus sp. QUAN TaxID=2781020 RepID=UPI00188F7BB8|nr:acetolactate synthase large subunit [Methylophilus sp. QUAN]MBF4991855.1 acetolactate synthase large subunit [Methylophilus sp. QUAN]
MAIYTGAQIAIKLLERQGIKIISGIPGGPILPFYDALSKSDQITHILARHEQGAGFIAQGIARSTGLPAVCVASSGPGATNLLTAIADAKLDSIPLIAITGQVPQSMIGTDAFQEVDTYGLSLPITKHNFLIKSAKELLDVIPRAFSIAMSGRPGPVLIDLPKDVQNEILDISEFPEPGQIEAQPSHSSENNYEEAASLINSAKRPILYLGGGVVHADSADAAIAFAEKSSIPTVMTLMALGTLPMTHSLSLGMLGMHGARYTNLALDECDLLIVVGARLDDRATGKIEKFCPRAKLIHVDIDPSEIGKLRMPHLPIVGDAGHFLKSILPMIELNQRPQWIERINELKTIHPLSKPGIDDISTHFGLINAAANCLPSDAIIVTDVGQHQMWVAQSYPLNRSRHWLTSGGLGTMGFGLPAAIGAAVANPKKTVVCFTGDGSIMMNIQELATAAELNVNIKIILMNNQSLGMVHQQQAMFFDKRIFASKYQTASKFMMIAEGFGIAAVDLDTSSNPELSLMKALQGRGPCLIHSSVDIHQHVLPIVPPGASNLEMIGN